MIPEGSPLSRHATVVPLRGGQEDPVGETDAFRGAQAAGDREVALRPNARYLNRELSLLEFATDVTERSRLSCQIRVSDALDGLILRLPARDD